MCRTSEFADSQPYGKPIRSFPESRFKASAMARRQVTFEELFAILDDEYGRARPPQCRVCVTPLPIRLVPADEVSANWFVVNPAECPYQCNVVLAEIVTRMMSEYELGRSAYVRRAPLAGRSRNAP